MNALSLFSGCGGDTCGMEMANFKVVGYCEINKTFQATHDANFPGCALIGANICAIPDDEFAKFTNIHAIFAGFPCQGFSNAGKKDPDDPRNTLFREFVRVTSVVQPALIVGENVKGLLTRKTAEGANYIDIIAGEFNRLGYDVAFRVLKAWEYGVAQHRERLIIVGTKRGNPLGWTPHFPVPQPLYMKPRNMVTYSNDGAAEVPPHWFADIPPHCVLEGFYEPGAPPHPYLLLKINDAVRTYAGKTHERLFSFGKRDSPIHCEIMDLSQPYTKTIICSYDHQPRLFVPQRNSRGCFLRAMLPDELKQVQGFHPDFVLCGSVKEQIVQIGNAAPPPLVRAVFAQYAL